MCTSSRKKLPLAWSHVTQNCARTAVGGAIISFSKYFHSFPPARGSQAKCRLPALPLAPPFFEKFTETLVAELRETARSPTRYQNDSR